MIDEQSPARHLPGWAEGGANDNAESQGAAQPDATVTADAATTATPRRKFTRQIDCSPRGWTTAWTDGCPW